MVWRKPSFLFALLEWLLLTVWPLKTDWPQHSMWNKSWEHPRTMVLMCYRNYKDKICNTDILRMQYACCYRLPVIQSPQNISTLYYLWRAVYKPHLWCIESLGWVSGCQTQVSGPQTTTRCAEGYLYLSYILSECKILKNQNKKVSQLLKKGEKEKMYSQIRRNGRLENTKKEMIKNTAIPQRTCQA